VVPGISSQPAERITSSFRSMQLPGYTTFGRLVNLRRRGLGRGATIDVVIDRPPTTDGWAFELTKVSVVLDLRTIGLPKKMILAFPLSRCMLKTCNLIAMQMRCVRRTAGSNTGMRCSGLAV
jgi:hypothetical protein